MTRLDDRATIVGVEYRVLGPISAYSNGEPAKLGGKRQQMVLAVLLATPNQPVSQDVLIDSVWGGYPPESAITTLHSYVSNLRRLLGGSIDREGSGYIVRVDDGTLDSIVFEGLMAQARTAATPDATLDAAGTALRMWHGRAFGDLGDEPALMGEARRLEEARLATLEIRIEADLAVGNHSAVIQELGALTAEHPYRERLRGFLMLALYRAGRQADALRVFQETTRFLGDELGIEPSAELQELEERILTHDPSLDFADRGSTTIERAARGYELRDKIRDTPYGVLFRGFQGSVGREVAVLKLSDLISEDPKFVRRFESEMRAVSELDHPYLVPIFDFWRDPEGAYLVTALPRGGTTREILVGEPWHISALNRFVDQIGSALSYIHRNGFFHGALTLESILLDGESNAYISDLGLSGLVPGSDRSATSVEDVTALARVVFLLLTGSDSPPGSPLSELRPDLSELDAVFARAWHPDESSRYQKPEDFGRALRLANGGDVVVAPLEIPTGSRRNPYKGLRAFKESESADFHGRDSLIEDLTEIIASKRLIAVVGPSGSGKSSLVRAGLLPALRSGAVGGSENWLIAEMFPGTHPFEELEAALVRVAAERPGALINELTSDSRGLVRAAKMIIGNDQDELVVLIDQFEELFSLVSSETSRRLFLDSLTAAAQDERSRLRLIVTLRADFFDQPLQYPEFGEALSAGLLAITPPSKEGLTRAIAQPARNVGVDLQPGLVTRIIDDVRDEPGALPLMQYALTELFNDRVNNTMTLAAYEESGGVAGALANRADEIYGDLSDEGKTAARNLFLRLVNVDELADDTRRRVRQTELRGLSLNQAVLDDVIQQFGRYRLLSFDRDAATRTPTVEVAHEALIREWDRLRTWIDDRREDLLINRRMHLTARDWEDSEKDPSYLLRGSRLEQALVWQERTDIAITDDEMTFIEASIEQEKRDFAEHAALVAKVARRRKAVIGVLAGGLVVAIVAGALAVESRRQAELEALSNQSMALRPTNRSVAALLAVEAYQRGGGARAWSALLGTVTAAPNFLGYQYLPGKASVRVDGRPVASLEGAPIPGSSRAVVALDGTELGVFDLETGELEMPFDTGLNEAFESVIGVSADGKRVAHLVFSPDIRSCEATSSNCSVLTVFDLETGETVVEPFDVTFNAGDVALSADGSMVAIAGGLDGDLVVYDARDGTFIGTLPGLGPGALRRNTAALTFSRDGMLYVGSQEGQVRLVEPETLEVLATIEAPTQSSNLDLVATEEGTVLALGLDAIVAVEGTGQVRWTADLRDGHNRPCPYMAVSESVDRLFCGNFFGIIQERDLQTGEPTGRILDPQLGEVGTLSVTADGRELVAFGAEVPAISRWRLDRTGPMIRRIADGYVAIDGYEPDGGMILVQERAPMADGEPRMSTTEAILGTLPEELGRFVVWDPDENRPDQFIAGELEGAGWVGPDLITALDPRREEFVFYNTDSREFVAGPMIPLERTENIWPGAGGTRFYALLRNPGEVWTFDAGTLARIEPTIRIDGTPLWVSATRNGAQVVVTYDVETGPPTTSVFDGHSGELIVGGLAGPGRHSVSLNGLLVGAEGGAITQYDLKTLEPIAVLPGARGEVNSLQWSENERVLLAHSNDQTVSVYDVATWTRIGDPIPTGTPLTFAGHLNAILPAMAALRLDGGAVAVIVSDGVEVWDIDPEHLAEAACRMAGRNLTETEWETYLGSLGEYRETCGF